MSRNFFSAPLFSLAFGVGYSCAIYANLPLFRYYPLVSRFSRDDLTDPSLGPAITWFGWIATAAIGAAIVTAFVPRRIGDRVPAFAFWFLPLLVLAAAFYREREWFFAPA